MSMIEKMTISGIRSFGPEKSDKQEITFKSPLTLILGANGCGKTTIIECLKYALTGDTPPGTNKGQSFVNDPKVAKSVESLGQVKLRIRNMKGHQVTVSRGMKTFFKKGLLKFETLNPSIAVVDENGAQVQITHRCLDINTEMCQSMGVSKAIINNVIFCHQEDSDWPLDEGKKLKDKFDAIFDTTQYNKAIDKILKLIKSYQELQKQKEIELKGLVLVKTETEKKQLKLTVAQTELGKAKEKVEYCEAELQPIKDRLIKIQELEYNVSKLHAEKISLQTSLKNCQEQQKSLKKKIKNIFEGSDKMLEIEISSFENKVEEKRNQLDDLNNKLQSNRIQEKKLSSTLSDLEKKRTTLSFQRQQEQDLISERAQKINELYQKLNIGTANLDSQNISQLSFDVMDQIKRGLNNEDKTISQLSKSHDEIEQNLQKDIDKIRENKVSVEADIESNKIQTFNLEKERKNIEREINAVEKSALKLKVLSDKITKLNGQYENLSKSTNIVELKEDINKRKESQEKLQEKLDKIDDDIRYLNSISNITSEISMKEKLLKDRETEAKRLKNKHSDNLKKLFPKSTLENNFKRNVENLSQDIQKQIKDINSGINKYQLQIAEYRTMRSNQMEEIKKFENELRENEEKIYEHCNLLPYEEVLSKLKENIDKMQLEYGSSKSAEMLYKCYIDKMGSDPCCPLCHKDMTNSEVSTLSTELTDEIRRLPEKIAKTEQQLKLLKKKYDNLLALRPVIENVEYLKKEIPIRQDKLKKIAQNITNAVSESESLQMAIIEPEHNLSTINSLTGDMSLLDESIKDITKLKGQLDLSKAKLPPPRETSTTDLDEAQLEKTTISAEIRNERVKIQQLEKKAEQNIDQLNSIREVRNGLKDEQIKLQEGVQALSQLKVRLEDIQKQVQDLSILKHNLETKLGPLREELNLALQKKDKARRENREKLNTEQSKFNELKRMNLDIQKFNQQLEELDKLNISQEIEYVRTSMKKYQEEQKQKVEKGDILLAKIETIKEDILSQGDKSRELMDNRELKKLQINETKIQEKFDQLDKDLGDADFKSLSREKNKLMQQNDNLMCQRSEYVGSQNELKRQIAVTEKELQQDMYKNSIKNYRYALHEMEALKLVLHDVREYRVALEWALLKFHSEKMQKINQIIREYWRSIYRGNDIDYIEIKTEEGTGNDTNKKRTYNYRVVQSKNDVELDMRGRCSAGQRVLACLIIRIALAETFSTNCGVLALDEPTTNLDRPNIISLCEVLTRIIEERQLQSNFMLIVITHDEEFVKTLGNMQSFYKCYRSNSGKSIIEKVRPL